MRKTTLVILFTILLLIGCLPKDDDELKIGFVAGLSGKYSSLGTSIRDGFELAFDEIDYKINDTKVNIVYKDDKQEEKEAKNAIDYFINNDIKLIVGNATSSMTSVSYKIVNKQKDMLLFSPTASSSEFSAIDDNFLRLQVEPSKKDIRTY